ncbi:hypothetical protein QQ045_032346 [Rhodiola kirilowii]
MVVKRLGRKRGLKMGCIFGSPRSSGGEGWLRRRLGAWRGGAAGRLRRLLLGTSALYGGVRAAESFGLGFFLSVFSWRCLCEEDGPVWSFRAATLFWGRRIRCS